MHDDIEHLVERSLDERAGRLTPGQGSLADVMERADRRQQRRRASAVVGSLAVAAVGLVGLSVVQGADEPLGRSDGLDAAPASTVALQVIDGSLDAWRCDGPIDVDRDVGDTSSYFEACTPVSIADGVPIHVVPTTMAMEVPATWIECPAWDPADVDAAAATTTPCGTIPPTTFAVCEQSNGGMTVTVPCVTSPPLPVATTAPTADLSTTTTSTTTTIPSDALVHTVEAGDSLMAIAERYQISIEALVGFNGWGDGVDHVIVPGDVIALPPDAVLP